MTMTQKRGKKGENIALKSLEAHLPRFAAIEVPGTLKEKLLAAIPNKQSKAVPKHRVQRWPRAWEFGAAAAAVLILALIFVTNYGPSRPSQLVIADINDRPTYNILADQNNASLGVAEPCGLQWSITNQNEP